MPYPLNIMCVQNVILHFEHIVINFSFFLLVADVGGV